MALHGGVQRGLHHAFALGVQRAGGFVQQQQRRVLQDGAGDGNALLLPARQPHAALAQEGVVPLGQGHDEVVGKCRLGGGVDLLCRRARVAIADVFERGSAKNHRVLGNGGNVAAQRGKGNVPNVHPVEEDTGALGLPSRPLDVIKALQQLENGGLAGATGTHQGHGLSGGQGE